MINKLQKKSYDILANACKEAYEAGLLTGDNLAFAGEDFNSFYDDNGLGAIETEEGGRRVKELDKQRQEWLQSDDANKKAVAKATPEFIKVNYGLDKEQAASFYYSHADYFLTASMEVKTYGDGSKKASYIVFELLDENNKQVPNHLVAVARNACFPGHHEYDDYLKQIGASACRWMWREYELLNSSKVPR